MTFHNPFPRPAEKDSAWPPIMRSAILWAFVALVWYFAAVGIVTVSTRGYAKFECNMGLSLAACDWLEEQR